MAKTAKRGRSAATKRRTHRVGRVTVFRYRGRGEYYGRWTDDSGTRRTQKLDRSLTRAKRSAARIHEAVAQGYLGTHPDEPMRRPLASLLSEYEGKLARTAGEKHIRTVTNALRRCFAAANIERVGQVTARLLQSYLDDMARGDRNACRRRRSRGHYENDCGEGTQEAAGPGARGGGGEPSRREGTTDGITAARDDQRRQGVGRSAGTVRHHRGYIKSFFKWAYESDRMKENPAKGIESHAGPKVRRRQANTREQVNAIIKAADSGPHEYERPAVRLGYWAGMRQNEILEVRWGNIDIQTCPDCRGAGYDRDGRVCEQCGGGARIGEYTLTEEQQKNERDTETPLDPDLIDYLIDYRKQTEEELGRQVGLTDKVVRNAPSSARTLSDHRKALCARAGVEYKNDLKELCDWHSMRHTFITLLGEDPNIDINSKMNLARHADISMTQKYDHSNMRRQRAGLARRRAQRLDTPPQPTTPAPAAATGTDKVVPLRQRPAAEGGAE